MRAPMRGWLLVALGAWGPWCASANDVTAGAASDLSVTVYRAPSRFSQSLDLDQLGGFALVSETRTVLLAAGESRLRFEGVADGIESSSAIITGLPSGIVEKNRDARLLSPSALVAAALGTQVTLVRTEPKSGHSVRVSGTIRSDAQGGVVFQSSEGVEALRCSGLPETFSFSAATDLAATPTLSVLIRTPAPTTATVTLSYLSYGFDWTADYVASLSSDAKSMNIGAWVTLANSNSVSFPAAHAQVVAGRLNRESGEVEPYEPASQILAQCWPRGTTSDTPERPDIELASPFGLPSPYRLERMQAAPMAELASQIVVTAQRVMEEQLGDLKLYRVPERTDVTSRQIKQVRLLDRSDVPIDIYYKADLTANQDTPSFFALRMLRTRNDLAHHLGIPLPAGRVDTFVRRAESSLLLSESALQDTAVDEKVEIGLGHSPDVQVSATTERAAVDPATLTQALPWLPRVRRSHSAVTDRLNRIQISNARDTDIAFELRLQLPDGEQLIAADPAPTERTAAPLFKLTVPAGGVATIRYQTEH